MPSSVSLCWVLIARDTWHLSFSTLSQWIILCHFSTSASLEKKNCQFFFVQTMTFPVVVTVDQLRTLKSHSEFSSVEKAICHPFTYSYSSLNCSFHLFQCASWLFWPFVKQGQALCQNSDHQQRVFHMTSCGWVDLYGVGGIWGHAGCRGLGKPPASEGGGPDGSSTD